MLKKQEIGRSMVEMLGVLAIVGVLSVGGIAGYTNAMNKHRANELLNEASKRAVVVVPQIAMGNTPSIGEFTNPSDHNFELKGPDGATAWKDTDKQFSITISGVSEAVCQQMKNVAGAVIKGFKPDTCADGDTVILTYNNDMSVEGLASGGAESGGGTSNPSDYDGDETGCKADSSRQYCAGNDTCISTAETCSSSAYCSGHGYKDSNEECVCDPGYSGTECATAQCTTGQYCDWDEGWCCPEGEACTNDGFGEGDCFKISDGCTTNADCIGQTVGTTTCTSKNCYCTLESTSWGEIPDKGTCTILDAGWKTTYENGSDKKTFLVGPEVTQWSANNWCKAHGRSLVRLSTLNRLFDFDDDYFTYSKLATNSYWNNGTLVGEEYWISHSTNGYSNYFSVRNEVEYGAYLDSGEPQTSFYALCE